LYAVSHEKNHPGQENGRQLLFPPELLDRLVGEALDRLIRLTSPDPDGAGPLAAPVTEYAYDDAGQLIAVTDPLGQTTTYTYDNLGRVVEERWLDGPTVVRTIAYAYDSAGRLATVQQSGVTGGNAVAEKRVDFAYDAFGRYSAITRYADLAATQLVAGTTFTYDDAGRLTDLTHAQGETALAGYTWTYDSAGRITQFTSLLPPRRNRGLHP